MTQDDGLERPPALKSNEVRTLADSTAESIAIGAALPAMRPVVQVAGFTALRETVGQMLRGGLGFHAVVEQLEIAPEDRRRLLADDLVIETMRLNGEARRLLLMDSYLELVEDLGTGTLRDILEAEEVSPATKLKALHELHGVAGFGGEKKGVEVNVLQVNQNSAKTVEFEERRRRKMVEAGRRSTDEWREGGPADER